jgi:hypothetical protein
MNDQKPRFEHFLKKEVAVWAHRVRLLITILLLMIVGLLDICMPIPFWNAFDGIPEK